MRLVLSILFYGLWALSFAAVLIGGVLWVREAHRLEKERERIWARRHP